MKTMVVVRGSVTTTASNSRSYSPCFVFYSSVDARSSLEHSLPLVCVFSELVQRGHRCTFLVRSEEEAAILISVFESVCPRGVWDRGSFSVMASMGESVVELTATSSVVGVVDFMSKEFSQVLGKYGLAYYVTFPGTMKMLKKYAFSGGGFFGGRRQRSRYADVAENAVACFVSSVEAIEADASCWPETVPENVYFVRTFGPSPSIVGDQYLEKDERRAAVVVSCGGLSFEKQRERLSALYRGLALCRDKLVVFWHGPPPPEEGSNDDDSSWLVAIKDARPRLSLLASAKVVALVTPCDWSDVTDAACCGVPILALPLTLEQMVNAGSAAELGVCEIIDSRDSERCFTPQRLASKLLALSAADSKYQIHALSLQVNHFSNPEDYGSALVANVIENDLDDGTLAKAQADTLRRIASSLDDSVQTYTLSSNKKSASCASDFDSGFYSAFCSSLD